MGRQADPVEQGPARDRSEVALDPLDAVQLERLARAKVFATGLLGLCVAMFVVSRLLRDAYPAFGYVAAFAEAAIIGALADWYAVVALFRHPLGVPLPHTAIIAANQARIAENLGRFIETHLLAPAPIAERLQQIRFAALAGGWLADPQRNAPVVDRAVRLLPQVVRALEEAGLREALARGAIARLRAIELAPIAAGVLDSVVRDGRHHELLDAVLTALHRLLADESMIAAMRAKIRAELPWLANAFRADDYVLQRLLRSAVALLHDAQGDRDHPLRREFDAFVLRSIEQLRQSPPHQARIEAIKNDLLAQPQLASFVLDQWRRFEQWLAEDVQADASVVRHHAGEFVAGIGRQIAADDAMRASIDRSVSAALQALIQEHKHRGSQFVAEQVQSWDVTELTRLVELNIGRDLQFIRVNGTIVGGLIGLGIYTLTRLAHL